MFEDSLFHRDAMPLFALGVPRSGTTALQQLVNAHPQIVMTDELRVVSWLDIEAAKLADGFSVHGNPYPFNHGADFAQYLRGNAGTLLRPFYLHLAEKSGKTHVRYWGDKYPHYDTLLGKLQLMFPRARYLMIHRDLRDVTLSVMRGHKWDAKTSSEYVCSIYANYMRQIASIEARGADSACAVMHVSYDDFVRNEVCVAKRIYQWLGLECSADALRSVGELSRVQSHSLRDPSRPPLKFDGSAALNRWSTALVGDELSTVEAMMSSIPDEISAGLAAVQRSRSWGAARDT